MLGLPEATRALDSGSRSSSPGWGCRWGTGSHLADPWLPVFPLPGGTGSCSPSRRRKSLGSCPIPAPNRSGYTGWKQRCDHTSGLGHVSANPSSRSVCPAGNVPCHPYRTLYAVVGPRLFLFSQCIAVLRRTSPLRMVV